MAGPFCKLISPHTDETYFVLFRSVSIDCDLYKIVHGCTAMNNLIKVTRVKCCTNLYSRTCYIAVVMKNIHISDRYQHFKQKARLDAGHAHNFDCDVRTLRRHQLLAYSWQIYYLFFVIISNFIHKAPPEQYSVKN